MEARGSFSSNSEATSTNEIRDRYAGRLKGALSNDEALFASEQMLQILMDSMTDAVFWKDLDHRFVGCNKAFSESAGFEPSLLLGKSDADMPWADAEEYSSEWFADWDRSVLESGEPQYGILERLTRADGSVTWIETNKVPLRDRQGEIIGLLGTFKNVTEYHEAQEELRRTLEDLDDRVQERTAEIERANEALRREVDDRIRSQAEERQQRTYAETLRDTAAAMSRSFDLPTVTEQALSGLERLVSNDLAAILLTSSNGDLELSRHHAGFGYLDDHPVDSDLDTETLSKLSIIQRLADSPGPVIVSSPQRALGPAKCVLGARMRQADQIVGYLLVESATSEFFTDDHAERLGAVADQAGAVISNARLAERVSELAAAEERQRLARDLHDAINQTLWTASLSAESLLNDVPPESDLHRRIDRLRQLTRGALSEMRGLLLELRPDELADVDLHELVRHLLNALEARRKIEVTADVRPIDVGPALHTALYRIAQQALSNTVQHSNASELDVRLVPGPPIVLRVADNGDGFDLAEVPGGRMGLHIMRERAEAVGADITIESTIGEGTTVTVMVEP
jgi:PAS domain S-box-containing protein